ncbi:hypothetical protein F0562_032978 [Nyssa sinensis]|uniref:X8 domain-containing protein n=1 Tax=Nyssa sinensis TaxID=561372 RepID=A0A5J5AP63_9ASTE|nr:hypothetical protein F0562_032978 [Nyssa sinensis]
MAVFLLCLVFFLAMAGHSSAIYCVCKDGLSDSVYQKNIDYACGAGADCTPIIQNGACYNPNTVKDHCNYAVNSYFQRKAQISGSCDFSGTAITSQTLSTTQTSTCVYPSSASSTTPTTNGSTTTPSTSTGTPTIATPGTTTTTPVFGLGPSGTITNTDSGSVSLHQNTNLFCSFTLTLLFSGLIFLRV